MEFILASASPRRKEILERAGFTFLVKTAQVDETVEEKFTPEDLVMFLAKKKALAVARAFPNQIVVGADTIVSLEEKILGKPRDRQEACQTLSSLSGRTHSVYTGVAICDASRSHTFYERTEVTFYSLTQKEIDNYIATGEPMDKAGAYGIQGKGCLLVKEIKGDYYNVVGFPVAKFSRELGVFLQTSV